MIITAMPENTESTASWFFMRDYPSSEPPENTEQVETTVTGDMPKQLTAQEEFVKLNQRVEELEQQIIPKLEDMDHKLEKLIQSHRSLIDYFSAVNERDVRDLNYKIRGYSSKGKQLRPVNFVPERSNTDI